MKRYICLLLILLLLTTAFGLNTFADNGTNEIKYSYYNTEPDSSAVYVFDVSYGKSTCTDENFYEIIVFDGCVTSVGGNNADIPDGGYVIAAKGERYRSKLEGIKKGDYCIIDKTEKKIIFLEEGYNPFFEKTIKFDKYNSTRNANTIVIYNKGETTGTNIWGNEVTVNADGFVSVVGGNNSPIPEGGFVISAVGAERIEELNQAAEIGLSVSVDDIRKTVTFTYNADSIKNAVKIKLDTAKKQLEDARLDFLIIDYEAAQQKIEMLEEAYNKVAQGIDDSNIPQAIAAENAFNNSYETLYLALTETPAVEGRALWLRPAGLTSTESVAARVKEIKELGYNIICLEMFYDSTFICPMPEDGYFIQNPSLKGFDLLQAFIDECKNQGVELQGWLPVYRVSYSTSTYYKDSLAAKKPEWLCLSKKGVDYVANEYGNGYFIDPANKEATDYLMSVYEYILNNYKLDGLQLDYIRFPNQTNEDFGYNEGIRNAFKDKYGSDPLDLKTSDDLWEKWIEFRCAYVTDFVNRIADKVKELSPMTTLSCDVAPNLEESRKSHLQNAEKWFGDGIVDMGYPMAYGPNVVSMYAGLTVEACGDKVLAYIGFGDYGSDVLVKQILEAREAGADGFAFFSYAQYMEGDYANNIENGILSKPSLSPTYNCKEAAKAQLETIVARIELILSNSSVTDTERTAAEKYKNSVTSVINELQTKSLSDCKDKLDALVSSEISFTNEKALNAVSEDIKLLGKIVRVNRDDYREFTETSTEESENISNDDSKSFEFPVWGYPVAGVILLAVAGAVVVIISKKKK